MSAGPGAMGSSAARPGAPVSTFGTARTRAERPWKPACTGRAGCPPRRVAPESHGGHADDHPPEPRAERFPGGIPGRVDERRREPGAGSLRSSRDPVDRNVPASTRRHGTHRGGPARECDRRRRPGRRVPHGAGTVRALGGLHFPTRPSGFGPGTGCPSGEEAAGRHVDGDRGAPCMVDPVLRPSVGRGLLRIRGDG